jgi:hypothetical protein
MNSVKKMHIFSDCVFITFACDSWHVWARWARHLDVYLPRQHSTDFLYVKYIGFQTYSGVFW